MYFWKKFQNFILKTLFYFNFKAWHFNYVQIISARGQINKMAYKVLSGPPFSNPIHSPFIFYTPTILQLVIPGLVLHSLQELCALQTVSIQPGTLSHFFTLDFTNTLPPYFLFPINAVLIPIEAIIFAYIIFIIIIIITTIIHLISEFLKAENVPFYFCISSTQKLPGIGFNHEPRNECLEIIL